MLLTTLLLFGMITSLFDDIRKSSSSSLFPFLITETPIENKLNFKHLKDAYLF